MCGMQQAWATGEIWRNLADLHADYEAVMLYQFMPISMFMTHLYHFVLLVIICCSLAFCYHH